MSEEEFFKPETMSHMMEFVELVQKRGPTGFSEFGATDTRSFIIGMLCGCAAANGMNARQTLAFVYHPTVQAMIDGACREEAA